MKSKLSSWSWQDIHCVYQTFSNQLMEYKMVADRFEIPVPMDKELRTMTHGIVKAKDQQFQDFINRWFRDVNKIVGQLSVLDREIARRNKLIGVMG